MRGKLQRGAQVTADPTAKNLGYGCRLFTTEARKESLGPIEDRVRQDTAYDAKKGEFAPEST